MNKLSVLRKQNNRDEEKISKKNKENYDNMILYIRGSKINEYHQEVIRQDIISMILGAEERGEGLKQVFNGDYKATIDEIIESAPVQDAKERFIYNLATVFLIAFISLSIIFVTSTIGQLLRGDMLRYVLLLGDVVTFLVIGVAAVVVINMLTSGIVFAKDQNKKINMGFFVILAISFGLVFLNILFTPRIVLVDSSIVVGVVLIAIIGAGYFIINKLYMDKYYTEI